MRAIWITLLCAVFAYSVLVLPAAVIFAQWRFAGLLTVCAVVSGALLWRRPRSGDTE